MNSLSIRESSSFPPPPHIFNSFVCLVSVWGGRELRAGRLLLNGRAERVGESLL